MAEAPGKTQCSKHGLQDETYVCAHIAGSLASGVPVGFHWAADSGQARPDAWCSSCEAARAKAGGNWTDELVAILDVKMVCGGCYDHAKQTWEASRKR